ncbi:unnamed protein product [Leptidea sinapis]|uniref:CUE domain-containing protein n=1 Tax=Leptidea sinapis TaxID=189913 RepID=A0A5E4Q8T0_9NEOP|nr:unnamed protein product [Leptidea sinapis]
MALTADKLINEERFCGDNPIQFLLYLPFGLFLMSIRIVLGVILWMTSFVLPDKSAARQLISTLACLTFGVYIKRKGSRDPKCSVLVANYVSCLDSLAAARALGTISLRKWKVPPFFASTLGIKNVSLFARKQHFAESPNKPVLLQPEGGPTNGKGILKFTDWPFSIGNRVQPVAISVERPFTNVTVHKDADAARRFPWRDVVWFLCSPVSVLTVTALPAMERNDESDATFSARLRHTIADALKVETVDLSWEDLRLACLPRRAGNSAPGAGHSRAMGNTSPELARMAARVKEVLPNVPVNDIIRDLAKTRSVDVTITNFLEGFTQFTPEPAPIIEPQPSTSQSQPKYITPVPTGVFPKTAKERQMSFQERKMQMIAEARKKYIERNGLNVAMNC